MENLQNETLFRYQVISLVMALVQGGNSVTCAIREVAAMDHLDCRQKCRKVSQRTLYRWLKIFRKSGFSGLSPHKTIRPGGTRALSKEFVSWLKNEKENDPVASIPELIVRAKEKGVIDERTNICRSTVWRMMKKERIPHERRETSRIKDVRRFAYPNRMQMVLCDGKHFRAGVGRFKRLAMFYLDDATRFILNVVVGESENTQLFQQGLYDTITRYGMMSVMYLDHGPGYISLDTAMVLKELGILLVHGQVKYPQGHGKIERFHRTLIADYLRQIPGNMEIDPACEALRLRLLHYSREIYNKRAHESLGGKTPHDVFFANHQPSLQFVKNDFELKKAFAIAIKRRVSSDNVIKFNNTEYEMPLGYAGLVVCLEHRLLSGHLYFETRGQCIRLHEVQSHQNAITQRAKMGKIKDNPNAKTHPADNNLSNNPDKNPQSGKSFAGMQFEKTFKPLVGTDGGFNDSWGINDGNDVKNDKLGKDGKK